jgi:uncharacterized membrane protein
MNTPRPNVDSWERFASVAAGVALGVLAAKKRHSPVAIAAGAAGAALVLRGASGYCPVNQLLNRGRSLDDTRTALGGNRGIKIEERITIQRSAVELYNLWRPLQNLARLLPHIERVDVIDEVRSHWVMRGPAGVNFEWDAEIINDVRPELIAWRSLEGAEVASAGSVTFRDCGDADCDSTEVTVTLQYEPAAGKAGAFVASLLGQAPAKMLREDLRRFKDEIETGDTTLALGTMPVQAHTH